MIKMLRRERHHENLVIDHVETENAEGIFYFLASARTVSEEINFHDNDSMFVLIMVMVMLIKMPMLMARMLTFCNHRKPLLGRLHTLG